MPIVAKPIIPSGRCFGLGGVVFGRRLSSRSLSSGCCGFRLLRGDRLSTLTSTALLHCVFSDAGGIEKSTNTIGGQGACAKPMADAILS